MDFFTIVPDCSWVESKKTDPRSMHARSCDFDSVLLRSKTLELLKPKPREGSAYCRPFLARHLILRAHQRRALTVTTRVAFAVRLPEVPPMFTVTFPVVAVLLAVSVNTLDEVVGFVENDAVTPLGKPDASKVTLPVNPFTGCTVMVLVLLLPWVTV